MKSEENIPFSDEIFSILTNRGDLLRITQNNFWDLYPAWSQDGSEIAFLSQRSTSLGVFIMNADGSNQRMLYDSSLHEADIDWEGEYIAFTKNSSIWIMNSDGSNVHQVSNPPRAGEWGQANLPFGDYDPRISPNGKKILFERLVDDQSPNGNYDFFVIDIDGTNEIQITHSGYSQGLGSWSDSGDKITFIVAAIGVTGKYHIYLMSSDGTDNRDITPDYFPSDFLSRWVGFSSDGAALYFIGEWWQD